MASSGENDIARQKAIERQEEMIELFQTKLKETRERIREKTSELRDLDSGTKGTTHQSQAQRALIVRDLTELERDEYEWDWNVDAHKASLRDLLDKP
jgi:hypothetical protein